MTWKMGYCKKCHSWESYGSSGSDLCSGCGLKLTMTDLTTDDWEKLNEGQKQAYTKKYDAMDSDITERDAGFFEIVGGDNHKKVVSRIRFLGSLLLIFGMIGAICCFLYGCSISTNSYSEGIGLVFVIMSFISAIFAYLVPFVLYGIALCVEQTSNK